MKMQRIKAKKKDLRDVFWLASQLLVDLKEDEFIKKVKRQEKKMQYELFGFYKKGELVGLCGVMPFYVLYHDKCLYLCDFVIAEEHRGKGFGWKSLEMVEKYAKDKGYNEIELSSSFSRELAHLFYENKMNFNKSGYVFNKKIDN